MMQNKIQSQEFQGVVILMVRYTIVRNGDGNLNVPYLYENGGKVVLNWNWLDNDWNSTNPALRFANLSFLLRLCVEGVLFLLIFLDLSMPATKLSSGFYELFR